MLDKYNNLSKKLTYQFTDKALLMTALTHRSYGKKNNERLEFLGDSVLELIISQALYAKFNKANEGQLTAIRAQLVRKETLSQLAKELKLDDYLKLGVGELKSGGKHRQSILADTLEAVIAAIFLDAGFSETKRVVLFIYQKKLKDASLKNNNNKDAKTKLQEHLQNKHLRLPEYTLAKAQGKDHNIRFTVRCTLLDENISVEQTSGNIKTAEQLCAQILLKQLTKNDT